MKTTLRITAAALAEIVLFGLLLFAPAGTFDYWQAWVFLAVFAVAAVVAGIFMRIYDPAVMQRRLRGGPVAETRPVQKIVMVGLWLSLAAMLALSAIDHRLGWSSVPMTVSLAGDVLVVSGLGVSMLVVVQNSYAAATITVEPGQQLVTTGLYGLVRHPMYAASTIMIGGTPLALGSYWGLAMLVPCLVALVVRTVDEEAMLEQELQGYHEYTQKVRYRLVPYVW